MGTRSIIAVPDAEHGWKGRYCHWDGYPSWMGEQLRHLVLRDGLSAAVRTLTEEHTRWSSVTADTSNYKPPSYAPDEGKNLVQGYGLAPDDEPADGWVYADGDDWGTEWAYLLGEGGIAVFERRFGRPEGDEGHGTGMFGMGASDTEAGGYWLRRGFVSFTDAEGMERIEQDRAAA